MCQHGIRSTWGRDENLALINFPETSAKRMESVKVYKGVTYTLEQQLVRSVECWATNLSKKRKSLSRNFKGESVEIDHIFYPDRQELVSETWIKLCQPKTKTQLEAIWENPDPNDGGVRGVSKFVSVVCFHVQEDIHRYKSVRKDEIFAPSADSLLTQTDSYEGASEDIGTIGELATDEIEGWQAFLINDLEGTLSAEEFQVLNNWIHGATVREIAEETNSSKSAVHRILAQAKDKAAEWIESLKHGSRAKTVAYRCPVFAQRSSLRPDRISKENLEAWNHLPVSVIFYNGEYAPNDPDVNWRESLTTKTSFVRASLECINPACQNGFAVGQYNLILPYDRRDEAKRFLPARTEQKNRMCEGCKKAVNSAHEKQAAASDWNSIRPEMAVNCLTKNESEKIPLESLCIPNEPTPAQISPN